MSLSAIARKLRVNRILAAWERLRDGLELRFGTAPQTQDC